MPQPSLMAVRHCLADMFLRGTFLWRLGAGPPKRAFLARHMILSWP